MGGVGGEEPNECLGLINSMPGMPGRHRYSVLIHVPHSVVRSPPPLSMRWGQGSLQCDSQVGESGSWPQPSTGPQQRVMIIGQSTRRIVVCRMPAERPPARPPARRAHSVCLRNSFACDTGRVVMNRRC